MASFPNKIRSDSIKFAFEITDVINRITKNHNWINACFSRGESHGSRRGYSCEVPIELDIHKPTVLRLVNRIDETYSKVHVAQQKKKELLNLLEKYETDVNDYKKVLSEGNFLT